MNHKQVERLLIFSKYKEFLGLLETFGYSIDYWEFKGVIKRIDGEVVGNIHNDFIDWEVEDKE